MSAPTRQQHHMSLALDHITEVAGHPEGVRTIYGGLCHSFPIVVRSCGLCQALAFVEAKATGGKERGDAYTLLRGHIASAFALRPDQLLPTIRAAEMPAYMRHTRTVLDAWIFYKRFAVSILKVESAHEGEEQDG